VVLVKAIDAIGQLKAHCGHASEGNGRPGWQPLMAEIPRNTAEHS
jgi:hypothetical protein